MVGGVVAVITAIVTFFAGRNASVAVLQNALVAGFKELNDQQNQKIADLVQEVAELKNNLGGEIAQLKSDLAAEQQRTIALKNLLRRNGIDIPRETATAVVFTPFPEGQD